MRKFIIPILVAATAIPAAPAAAQYWRLSNSVHREIRTDINQLQNRINRSAARGTISRREANGLRRDAVELRRLYHYYSRNGLTRNEVARLELGINRLHMRLRLERRDWDGRRG